MSIPAGETVAIREVAPRFRGRARKIAETIDGPEAVVQFAKRLLRDEPREHLLALHLDARSRPMAYTVVSVGSLTSTLAHPREVFTPALAVAAWAVVLVHNHPSGDPTPSPDDLAVAERIVKAGRLLGVECLDSLVIGYEGWASIRGLQPELFADEIRADRAATRDAA